MSNISSRLNGTVASLALFAGALLAHPAAAQQLAANNQTLVSATGELETVVVTGTAFNADVAPAKASLDTMEPQTIINKSYIQDSVANTADYTTILAIAPSMTGMDINGPGLSDGNVKNTLRGLPDGNFALLYDGIPFGDTNGPTHHSESYFPGSTIGSIDVDRGPGNAGNLGAATYGGSVNMFSESLAPDRHVRAAATYGSFNTLEYNGNYQSGDFSIGGVNNRAMVNLEGANSDGYLTLQTTARQNVLVKTQTDIAPGWTVTVFSNYNGLFQHLNDNNGATAAQIVAFGKAFALQNTNPNEGTYQAYNFISKKTDMDYVRLDGSFAGFTLDDTAYSYAYVNKTVTATNIEQSATDIANNVTEGLGTIVGGTKNAKDVPGYTKKNAYRVWGNTLRLSRDYDFGWISGQVRTGVWWEDAATQRARFDFDIQKCVAVGCDPWHDQTFADSSLLSKTKSAPFNGGFAEYNEHSSWDQYQPFVEIEMHPVEDLTVTPGFKYVWWKHNVNAPLEQKTVPVIPFSGSFTTTRSLPFLMANYKLQPSWSVYAQYAQGIYIPDISAFEQKSPALTFPKAETTTNYQLGTVYYADNFTFDGDLYYIGVINNIVFQPCNQAPLTGPSGETCAINTGTATYKGVEGEATYAFNDDSFSGMLDGLVMFVNGSINSSKTQGKWVKQAPMWTEASGLVYKTDLFKISLINKLVGQQYSDATNTQFYKLGAYDNTDFKASVTFGQFELDLGLYNLFNDRNLLSVGINDSATVGANVHDLTGRGASLDQYYFQPPRSYQISLTGRF